MKVWLIAVVAAGVGLGLGVGSTFAEFWGTQEYFHAPPQVAEVNEPLDPSAGVPKVVVVNGDRFEFGTSERNVKESHNFEIRNDGSAPLSVKVEHTTCKCTVADLKKTTLQPGETTTVKLEWEAKGYVDEFEQSAEISTNDPQNPVVKLTIVGRISQKVKPVPEELQVAGISANEDHVQQVRIFGYVVDQPVEITQHSLDSSDHADHYELAISPLAQAEIEAEPGAKSGVLVTLTIKSGLPIRALHQTIRLATNLAPDPIEIAVRGSVASDISLVYTSGAKSFVSEKNLVRLGKLHPNDAAKVHLFLLIKGPHSAETKVSVGSIDPANVLQVTLGEPTSLRAGAVVKYPVELTIPAGQEAISRQGGAQGQYGKVVFQTTHPIAKEVLLFVQFAIEE